MDEYIDVKIDVFEHPDQRARVRSSITVSTLIEEILKEFDDITANSPEKYAIYLKGAERPFNSTYTFTQLDIQPQDELVFDYFRQVIRQMLEPRYYAFLREETTGKVYDIQWTPAVIGRPTAEVDHNLTLAVNVQLLPNGMTISRRHAQITFSDGRYYIEPLAENNPVILNGKEVRLNSKREIKNGDKLIIGRHEIAMTFTTQQVSSSGFKSQPQSVQQPVKPVSQPVQHVSRPVQYPSAPQPAVVQPAQSESDQNKTLMGSEEIPPAYLVIERATTSEQVGQRLPIVDYPFPLGRNLPLLSAESEVSRRHAQLEFDQRSMRYFITDFQSTNGVTLEGEPIEPNRPYEVKPGMRIGLGTKVVLRFVV